MDWTILTAENEGFAGAYQEGAACPETAVIYAPGAGSDREEALQAASFLPENGLNTLVLGWMGWPGVPSRMENVPVEYVTRAIRYLKEERGIRRVLMAGVSEGAVYTLLAAVYHPEIGAVCAVCPLDYVMASPSSRGKINAVFTWQGKRISFVPFSTSHMSRWALLKGALTDPSYGRGRILRYACDQVRVRKIARIQVEKMRAPLLLIAPSYDDVWESEEAVKRIERRLRHQKYPYPVRTILYPHASHLMGGSYDMTDRGVRFLTRLLKAETDHPDACERARNDCLDQMLAFLEGNAV